VASTLRLVTIPSSHYCEKARWALDRAGVPFHEDPHLPLLSWVAARRAGGRRLVPVLATPDGPVVDSTDILAWCDAHGAAPPLFPSDQPDARALEDELDRRLGPATRLIAYAAILPRRDAVAAVFHATPAWEGRVVGATYPIVRRLMTRMLRIDAASLARARAIVDEIFATIARRLDGRRYLAGDRFSAADLTFAALAAPVIAPDEYGGPLPPRDTWGDDFASYVDRMRDTPAGRFALRLYADERAPAAR